MISSEQRNVTSARSRPGQPLQHLIAARPSVAAIPWPNLGLSWRPQTVVAVALLSDMMER
jgi:hypothetical protein